VAEGNNGFTLLDIERYIQGLNTDAKGRAETGAQRFAVAFHQSRMFLISEERLLAHAFARRNSNGMASNITIGEGRSPGFG
jgi:hypothetical protein